MEKLIPISFLIIPVLVFSQSEHYPMFKDCESVDAKEQKKCFYQQLPPIKQKK